MEWTWSCCGHGSYPGCGAVGLNGQGWEPVRQLQLPNVAKENQSGTMGNRMGNRSNMSSSACPAGADARRRRTMLLEWSEKRKKRQAQVLARKVGVSEPGEHFFWKSKMHIDPNQEADTWLSGHCLAVVEARMPDTGVGVSGMPSVYCDLISGELIGRMEVATLLLVPLGPPRAGDQWEALACWGAAPVRPVGTGFPGMNLWLFQSPSLLTAELMARWSIHLPNTGARASGWRIHPQCQEHFQQALSSSLFQLGLTFSFTISWRPKCLSNPCLCLSSECWAQCLKGGPVHPRRTLFPCRTAISMLYTGAALSPNKLCIPFVQPQLPSVLTLIL